MTNQEIEKRFLFDLEMGYFKNYDKGNTSLIYFDIYTYADLITLCKILISNGYNLDRNASDFTDLLLSQLFISTHVLYKVPICIKTKYFAIHDMEKVDKRFYDKDVFFNELPEYINEYRLEREDRVWSLIKR